MKLALLMTGTGTHIASWRMAGAPVGRATDVGWFAEVARKAEQACYDMLFIADSLYVNDHPTGMELRHPRHAHLSLEPVTLLAALAMVTDRIGLAATISTTYNAPYGVARALASLDHISRGRAGWNVVTSQSDLEARNHGVDLHAGHAERYARAGAFVDVVKGLWDSWEEDAVLGDQTAGVAVDPGRFHRLDHRGDFFSVAGPLNVPRPPQGHPLVIQAGSSGPGQALAASSADVVFTAQEDKANARRFYAGMKDQAAAAGRDPDQLVVMPGVMAVVAETQGEAEDRFASLQSLIHPKAGVALLSNLLGDIDLSNLDVDGPMPAIDQTNASKSRLEMMHRMGITQGMTVRQAYEALAPGRGHLTLVGSARDVADTLCDWHADGAADGFMLVPAVVPYAEDEFAKRVIPLLRQRGVSQSEYGSGTLRQMLGVATPANRFRCRENAAT
ncbi:LLM class flavin-dependent oxidoreductase [Novosphingobium sp. LASN5T]|uniref:LLM class flavin-dependent oxidoreductase n=1 Tax=Novosphingobium sp. LASN5T TaxID=2491021 RepID=UPI00168141BB|nr:LLM class flavin-dependent oxidoreductase [Novosphingobium sp. LASN5T]